MFPPSKTCANQNSIDQAVADEVDSPSTQNQLAPPTALAIAGYDPSAGAGVLADLKTFAAHGVYGMACITALTVQSTQGVRRVQGVDADIVTETLECLAEDASISAIKVGMLANAAVGAAVATWLERARGIPVVLDPVVLSTSGKALIDAAGLEVMRQRLLARVEWITPNLDELVALTGGTTPKNRAETETLAHRLLVLAENQGNHALNLVVTGGHSESPDDLLLSREICRWYSGERIQTSSTHGTGCAFSSALAARISLGDDVPVAVHEAKQYVTAALRHARPIGRGTGPIDHFWNFHRR